MIDFIWNNFLDSLFNIIFHYFRNILDSFWILLDFLFLRGLYLDLLLNFLFNFFRNYFINFLRNDCYFHYFLIMNLFYLFSHLFHFFLLFWLLDFDLLLRNLHFYHFLLIGWSFLFLFACIPDTT